MWEDGKLRLVFTWLLPGLAGELDKRSLSALLSAKRAKPPEWSGVTGELGSVLVR